ncbi:MAG: hypothetical protein RL596_2250 [Bacteroidota bacterium]
MLLRKNILVRLLMLLLLNGVFFVPAQAQFITISGTVYDISARRPLEAVAVQSTSGRGAITDSTGRYLLTVLKTDSIWFSMIGKSTMKYAIDTISNMENFDVMIHVRAYDLPEVKVRNNYYRFDSMMNRKDYAKIFDYKKPTFRAVTPSGYNPGAAVGFDLGSIIDMFRFKYNRSMLTLQKRLLEEEHEKYINSRFTKPFVKKITKLQSPELDTFMRRYRPTYEFLQQVNELELGHYITKSLEQYKSTRYNWRGGYYRRREN